MRGEGRLGADAFTWRMSRQPPGIPADHECEGTNPQPAGTLGPGSGAGSAARVPWSSSQSPLSCGVAGGASIASGGSGYGSSDDTPQCLRPAASTSRQFGSSTATLARRSAVGNQAQTASAVVPEGGQAAFVPAPTLSVGIIGCGPTSAGFSPRPSQQQHPPQPSQRSATDACSQNVSARHSWSGEPQGLALPPVPGSVFAASCAPFAARGPGGTSAANPATAHGSVTPSRYMAQQHACSVGAARLPVHIHDQLQPLLAWDKLQLSTQQYPNQDPQDKPTLRGSRHWLACAVPAFRRCWPVPASALAFTLLAHALGYGGWQRALPGTQAIFIMSWLQCCWAFMSCQGRRTTLRLAQLAAVCLGILMLLPRGEIYGTGLWASAFDEEGGLRLPGLAISLARFFGVFADSAGGQPELESLEDVEVHRALVRFQVSLAVVLVLWVLQAGAASYTLPAAAGVTTPAGSGPAALHSMSVLMSTQKSHLDLPTLDALQPLYDCAVRPDALACGGSKPGLEFGAGGLQPMQSCCVPTLGVAHPGHLPGGHRRHRALAGVLAGQRALLAGVCVVQGAAAVALIAVWETLPERAPLTPESAQTSPIVGPQERTYDTAATSWAAVGLLVTAMAAPLPLPSLLNPRRMLHSALLLRPSASRSLGLFLLDVNAAKLLLAVAVGLLVGWPAGAFTWQLLQVLTVLFGMARLHVDGVRRQKLQLQGAAGLAAGLQASCQSPGRLALAASGGVAGGCVFPPSVRDPGRVCGTAADADEPGAVAAGSCAAGADGGCTPAATAPLSAGGCSSSCSINAMLSPCSSGHSLSSSSGGGGEPHGSQAGASYGSVASPASSTGAAQLARRPLPASGLHLGHQHHQQPYDSHQQHPLPSPCVVTPPIANSKARPSRRCPSGVGSWCCLAEGLACFRSYGRAAAKPWSLLLASLSLLACMLWVALIAPPLALLGDEPSDVFLGLMETAPGAMSVLGLLAGTLAALVVSAGCLAWCAANGELRRRWRLDRAESRRLECLAWACGPPLVVAAVSALSWALGDERNTAAYVAAEALRCASLWPLVWLQEPWLLAGADAVGGCVQHVGCGVTCCVFRWCGLRPSSCAVPGGRCDLSKDKDCEGQLARGSSGRRGNWSLQVEVN